MMSINGIPLVFLTVGGLAIFLFVVTRIPVVGRIISALVFIGAIALLVAVVGEQGRFHPQIAAILARFSLDDQQVSGGEVRVRMAQDGHFWVRAKIGNVERRMLVDSGATVSAISEATATQSGIARRKGVTPVVLQTANGTVLASPATADRLTIGPIVARNLPVVVSSTFGRTDVLGMNFLSQLESWRVEGRTLILKPKAKTAT
jgi:aspartyl protease family protein